MEEITALRASAERNERNPRDLKVELAKRIITDFHSAEDARSAEDDFTRVFRNKQAPGEIEERTVNAGKRSLTLLLVETGLAASRAEARRLIEQGGVYIDGTRCEIVNEVVELREGLPTEVKVGKRRFLRLLAKG
jgi:tyrosyl-tRNA synthetase